MKKTVLSLIACALLPLAAVAQPKLCGNVVDASGWTGNVYADPFGIYSFDVADPSLTLNNVAKSKNLAGTGGGVVNDEYLYLYNVEVDGSYVHGSIYRAELADYSTSWQGTVSAFYQVPTALTWDASTGGYYGCFYNSYGDGYEFGTLLSPGRPGRVKIASVGERIVALADNDGGVVYAIGKSGVLYTIDEETGYMTVIGSTGVKASAKIQSACFTDNAVYWAAQTEDGASSLYKIDPADAATTLIGLFPNGEQFSCLYPFKAAAEDGAPAVIEDVTPNFEGASVTGTLSFTLPAKTFAGDELEDVLSWTVTKDGESIAAGTGNPGEDVTTGELTLDNDFNYLQIYTENSVGRSPIYKTAIFVGPDTPNSVGWGEATLTVSDDNVATVTWPAVTEGINGGYIVPEEITYKLVRMPDDVVVADGLKATTFSEQLPEKSGVTSYYYTVAAQFMGNEGYPEETNKVTVGSGFDVPFTENFEGDALDYWTVLDVNGDYCTWGSYGDAVYSQAGYIDGSDDWLISPAIRMKPGKYYKVEFKYWGGLPGYEDYRGHAFEVGFGKGTDPATFQILGKKQDIILDESDAKMFSAVVKVDDEGSYNVGIHDISPVDAYLLYVDDFSVTEGGTLQVPAQIDDLTAEADADGDLNVELSFTAPSLTAEGKLLEAIETIVIKRDENNTVKTFLNPQPGEKLSFTDTAENGLTDGYHTYAVTSTNDKGESIVTEVGVTVGVEIPGMATDVVAEEQADGVHLSWKAPETDVKGNPINVESLTYTITAVKYYTQEFNVVAEGVKETSFVDNSFDLDGEQFQAYYIVQATNRAGSDEGTTSNPLILGKSYELPMVENFSPEYERQSKYLWWLDLREDINTMNYFRFSVGMSSDGDDGCAAFYGPEGAFTNLRSGKIDMSATEKPQMSYDYYLSEELSIYASLSVEYSTDLKSWSEIDRLDYEDLDYVDGEAWATHTVDLSSLVGCPCVYLRLHGELNDEDCAIVIDNIHIQDGEATGIDNVSSVISPAHKGIYTIGGQLVSTEASANALRSLKPGVYVIGGRKMVVK